VDFALNAAHTPKPVGWITPDVVLFPLSSYRPELNLPYDAHKAGWEHVVRAGKPAVPTLNPAALAAAQQFGAGMDEVFLEPSEPVL
jgi:hypothetical protein